MKVVYVGGREGRKEERMNTIRGDMELWKKIYEFCYEFDYWGLMNSETSEEDIAYDLEKYPQNVRDYLETFMEDDGEAAEVAKALLEEMNMA